MTPQGWAVARFDLQSMPIPLWIETAMGSSAREPANPFPNPRPAFTEMTMIMLGPQPLSETLCRIAELARQTIPGVAEASVTLMQEGAACTLGFTGPLAAHLDERQYDAGSGPCMDAARSGGTVAVADMASSGVYPDFGRVAHHHGITRSLSVGMPVERHVVGALNLYGRDGGTFDDRTGDLATTFASYAAVAVANAGADAGTAGLAISLQRAQDSRDVIDRAKGVLMREHHCSVAAAFAELVDRSLTLHRKLRDIAQDIVDDVQHGQPR